MVRNYRKILTRLFAVGLGLAPLLLFELFLALAGWGDPKTSVDPFVGFRNTRPLFVLDPSQQQYQVAANRQLCFRPDQFAAAKDNNEFRIFCLGGSTVQGRPYAIETSFTRWLELSLQAADPTRQWQVVNCGGISYASYRLVPILEEVLHYQPDLIIVYTGHNEFLEDRSYQSIKSRPEWLALTLETASQLRTFNLLRSAYLGSHQAPSLSENVLPEEVQARLDFRGGLAQYKRDPGWHRGVVAHFQFNLERMIQMAHQAGVPIWIADPVTNLRTCPPFKSALRDQLSLQDQQAWNHLRQRASDSYRTDMTSSLGLLQQALAIDDEHAGLWYDMAKCYEAIGQFDLARQAYRQARDCDICPLRMITPLYKALERVNSKKRTKVIPVRTLFEQRCQHGIPGGFLLVDHVHPSMTGHRMIAELITNEMIQEQIVTPVAGWQQNRAASFQAHTSSLDDKYYMEGQRRLKGLQSWASGRARQIPPAQETPKPIQPEN
ncbi:MAG: tetratricopeptide repeat protein [Pirellulaceae bacterium]|nr:tetratricopeptide repeat protein [Pirellulaceae bacterium]